MDYSIIIPVFNKADLTQRCLEVLPSSIDGVGTGEVIVVDNASSDHTPRVLEQFPWIKLIRNEKNLGFAGANNQAARVAKGEYLVLLNNDTEPWPGWLAAMLKTAKSGNVGAVGARLLFPDKTIQHAGVVMSGNLFGFPSFFALHHNLMVPFDEPDVLRRQDMQVVTGACLLTPRALYEKLGGLDECYWNGYEDVDYCLKVGREGLRVVYEPDAVLYHFESQSGVQRFRKAAWNSQMLDSRWHGNMHFDAAEKNIQRQLLKQSVRSFQTGTCSMVTKAPGAKVVVFGNEPAEGRAAFEADIRANYSPVNAIVWATGADQLAQARESIRVRGLNYTAFVHGSTRLTRGWLDELFRQIVAMSTTIASTYTPDLALEENIATLAGDGRCTLVGLAAIPQHMTFEPFDSLEGSIADLLLRLIPHGYATRGVGKVIAELPELPLDAAFERKHGRRLRDLADPDPASIERVLLDRPRRKRGLVSIITLSWNAPAYTKLALDSIREHTSEPYEVIVVDNGSGPQTREMLEAIDDPHVRIIYNATNRGFGGGNNDGFVAARGEHLLVLNNDVIVTEGWLDSLLDPFDRFPGVGVTAPRSNKITGDQEVFDATYTDLEGMHAYAAERRVIHAQRGYFSDRVIGFCLCIDRRVIEQIGGFDERFTLGNFEDDDFSVRVRAAGYDIFVADDCFIHHFGSQSFKANNVDYSTTMNSNWEKFAAKWGYPLAFPTNGYDPRRAIYQGFDRRVHYAELPKVHEAPSPETGVPDRAFIATVTDERSWTAVAEFTRRYFQAFDAGSAVRLLIGSAAPPDAHTIGSRLEKMLKKLAIAEPKCADVEVRDIDDISAWESTSHGTSVWRVDEITDRSPSALRRLVEEKRA